MSDTELKHMSKGGESRRLEIFTGAGRRREWPAEVKARIVSESHASGETVCAVARRHGLTPQQLFTWRRLARGGELGGSAEAPVIFAPVVIEKPVRQRGSRSSRGAARGEGIVIEMSGVVIRVPAGADGATVTAVLRAVRATA